MPQNQEEIEAKLAAYIDGELDAAGRAEIEKHLEINPQHRTLIRDLMAQRDLVRSLPRATAPAEIAETLQGQLERSVLLGGGLDAGADTGMRISPWPHRGAIAAIILLTAGLSFFVYKVLPSNKPPELAVVPSRDAAPMPATLSTEPPVAELPLASADRTATDRSAERSVAGKVKNLPQADLAVAPAIAPSAAPTIAPSVQASVAPTEATPTTTAIASNVPNQPGDVAADVAAKPQAPDASAVALTPSAASGGGGGLNSNNNGEPFGTKSGTADLTIASATTALPEWSVVVTSDDPVATDAQVRAFLIANQIRFEPLPESAQKDEAGLVAESRLRGPVAQSLTRGLLDDRRAAVPATQPASLGLSPAAPTTQQVNGSIADKLPTTAPSVTGGSIASAVPSTPTTAPTIVANRAATTSPAAASDAEALAAPATQPTKESPTSPNASAEPTTQPSTGQLAGTDQTMLYCSDITVTQANDLKSMLALRAGQSAQLIESPQSQNAPTTGPAFTLSSPVVPATQPAGQTIDQSVNQNQNGLADQQTGGVPPQAQSILAQPVPATAAVDEKSDQKVNLVVIVRRGQLLANPGPTTVPAIAQPPVAAPVTPEKAAGPPAGG